ncbi:MAG TPA: glutamate mutase L, partial [Burkholderiaceae bacterium]|nr:glutamate mutase L [Burkholderiaceae bacterium]
AAHLRQPGAHERADRLAAHTEQLAATREDEAFDVALGSACVDLAVGRHVGRVKETYSVRGAVRLLFGKDLRRVNALIGVGGVFAYGPDPADVLRAGLARDDVPDALRPEAPELFLDSAYVLYAVGLLAKREPTAALRLLKRTLTRQG